jgi:F420-dependent oxidoreductase-like protein
MRLGVHVGHWEGEPHDVAALAREAESCGLDSVWVSETWGSDAVALCAWIAAHTSTIGIGAGVLQMPARTPATAAMAAITLDHLSGGRFRLGLGVSGPQVVEGWHGVPFGKPLTRTREYVEVVRAVLRREAPLEHDGEVYPLPLPGGSGKSLKTNVVPLRADVPIYLAAMGPRNVALAFDVADGWMPLFFSPEHVDAFELRAWPEAFDVAPMVPVALGDDIAECRDRLRPMIATYVGAYGPKGGNYYHDLVGRFGFGAQADAVQAAYLGGRPAEAIAAVPDALVDAVSLVGPAERVRDGLAAWRDAGVTTLLARAREPVTIRTLAAAAEGAL